MDPRNPPDQVDRVALELMDSFADCYCNPKLNIQTPVGRTVRRDGADNGSRVSEFTFEYLTVFVGL